MALDFPSNPTNGQVYDNFIYSSAKGTWKSLSAGASPSIITNAVISATASTPSTIPLTVNGAASQSANLQEWKNSAGISLVSFSNTGNVASSGNFVSSYVGGSPHFSSANTSSANDQFNYILAGSNDTGNKATHFINSSTRTVDGGANAYTIRNDGGPFNLGSSSFTTTINGLVSRPNQVSFQATKTDAHATASQYLVFNNVSHNIGNAYNASNGRFTAPIAGRYLINFATLLYSMGSSSSVYLFVNSSQQQFMGTYGQFTGSYAGQGASAVVNLNTNDYVQLYFTHNGTNLHSGYTVASGYFLG